jgi:hypothetical protein
MVDNKLEPYPFQGEFIALSDAVEYVAKFVYCDLKERVAKKRIRARIDYAVSEKKHELEVKRRDGGDRVSAEEFFSWAARQSGWGCLVEIPGIPIQIISGEARLTMPKFSIVAEGISMPQSPGETESQFHKLLETRAKLKYAELEIERLREEIATLIGD